MIKTELLLKLADICERQAEMIKELYALLAQHEATSDDLDERVRRLTEDLEAYI